MIDYEDQCVGCPAEMGCIGDSCRYRRVPILVCDDCGDEVNRLYDFDDEELCSGCVLKRIPIIYEL